MPIWLAILITFNALALLTVLVLLGFVIAWHPPRGKHLALVLFLATDLALIVSSLLFNTLSDVPSTPVLLLRILSTLIVSFLGLVTFSAFLLVVVITGRFGKALVVLMRAGLVLWVLLQRPLWSGDLFVPTVQPGTHLAIQVGQPAVVFGGLLLLGYQALTIGLVLHDRRRFDQPSLASAIALAQCGVAVVMIVPVLWEAMAFNWIALPVAVVTGYGVFRERRSIVETGRAAGGG